MANLEESRPSVEDLLSIIVVQNQRIYDVLLALVQDQEVFTRLIEVHSNMDNFGPKPYLETDDEEL